MRLIVDQTMVGVSAKNATVLRSLGKLLSSGKKNCSHTNKNSQFNWKFKLAKQNKTKTT